MTDTLDGYHMHERYPDMFKPKVKVEMVDNTVLPDIPGGSSLLFMNHASDKGPIYTGYTRSRNMSRKTRRILRRAARQFKYAVKILVVFVNEKGKIRGSSMKIKKEKEWGKKWIYTQITR